MFRGEVPREPLDAPARFRGRERRTALSGRDGETALSRTEKHGCNSASIPTSPRFFVRLKGPFLRPGLSSRWHRAQPRSRMAAGHRRRRRAASLTAASTVPPSTRPAARRRQDHPHPPRQTTRSPVLKPAHALRHADCRARPVMTRHLGGPCPRRPPPQTTRQAARALSRARNCRTTAPVSPATASRSQRIDPRALTPHLRPV